MSNYSALMSPIKVGGQVIKNRVVMSPMSTNYPNVDGSMSRKLHCHLVERARGGVGLITTGATAVCWPEGKAAENMLDISNPCIVPALHDLADSVHAFGAKVNVQILHGGFMSNPAFNGGIQSVCPSDFAGARALTVDEIKAIQEKFVISAKNVMASGLDGVEIHAASMYLINQFLNPVCNTRTDEYGGSMENRFRFLKEIIEGIRAACPRPFIVSVRLGVVDFPVGTTLEQGVQYAKWCEDCGADMLNLTTGFYTANEAMETQWDPEGARLYMAEAVKKEVGIPVSVVGKLRTPAFCNEAIENGVTDMVTIGRQLLCDPAWANKALFNKAETIRPCLNCSQGCAEQAFFKNGNIHCQINPYTGYNDLYSEACVPATARAKNIVVVGGGVTALQFAITASDRGHNVTIVEKSDKLGGQMNIACVPPFKSDLRKALDWFIGEVGRKNVKVILNTEATKQAVLDMHPDAVVLCTGSVPVCPPIRGIENAVESWDILDGSAEVPENKAVAIIGGGVVGSELAHMLVEHGNDVTVIEMLPEICRGHNPAHKGLLEAFLAQHADVSVNSRVTEVGTDSITYLNGDGAEVTKTVDEVVIAAGHRPAGGELYDSLIASGIETYRIGDCVRVDNIRYATRSALELAYSL